MRRLFNRLFIAPMLFAVSCGDNGPVPTAPSYSGGGVASVSNDLPDSSTNAPTPERSIYNPDPDTPIVAVDYQLPPPGGGDPFSGSHIAIDDFPVGSIIVSLPRDAIPAITNPRFAFPDEVGYLREDDLVLGLSINGEAKAYPHNIGWWHEIVNDVIGGHPVSVTFCPLTGTGLVFDATGIGGHQFELGVSGMLFNNNLIMYDRRDETLYPQIYFTGLDESGTGESLSLMPVVETTWASWKKLHPDTRVVESGSYRLDAYFEYPYIDSRRGGDYRTSNNYLLFDLDPWIGDNVNPSATEFEIKDTVLGVRLDGVPRAYPFETMGSQAVINDHLAGVDLVVVWDQSSRLAIPYVRHAGGRTLTFDIQAEDGFPFNMVDRETGSLWNVNGLAFAGELAGTQLTQIPAHNSFWFAWVTFFQETSVWSP